MAYWTQNTHLFCDDDYECSACGAVYDKPYKVCPNCDSEMSRIKYSASWVDEMADYDELIGYDDD